VEKREDEEKEASVKGLAKIYYINESSGGLAQLRTKVGFTVAAKQFPIRTTLLPLSLKGPTSPSILKELTSSSDVKISD
jgi:hypothetical protein